MSTIDDAVFQAAQKRATDRLKKTPVATAAKFDAKQGRIVVAMSSGLELSFKPTDVQSLEAAKPQDLAEIEISPAGLGLHFPALDADIYIPGLLEGFLGSRKWMAQKLGQLGGRSTSHAKSDAARANGAKGGRPRKKQTDAPASDGQRTRS